MTCLGPLPTGQVNLKVSCPGRKSACPRQPDRTFFEPCKTTVSHQLYNIVGQFLTHGKKKLLFTVPTDPFLKNVELAKTRTIMKTEKPI